MTRFFAIFWVEEGREETALRRSPTRQPAPFLPVEFATIPEIRAYDPNALICPPLPKKEEKIGLKARPVKAWAGGSGIVQSDCFAGCRPATRRNNIEIKSKHDFH